MSLRGYSGQIDIKSSLFLSDHCSISPSFPASTLTEQVLCMCQAHAMHCGDSDTQCRPAHGYLLPREGGELRIGQNADEGRVKSHRIWGRSSQKPSSPKANLIVPTILLYINML